jgi:hypothetical protein
MVHADEMNASAGTRYPFAKDYNFVYGNMTVLHFNTAVYDLIRF